eukprot:gene38739-5306_t
MPDDACGEEGACVIRVRFPVPPQLLHPWPCSLIAR